MDAILPYLMNAVGGAVFGPIISKLLGGKGSTGAIAGIIGGLAGGFGMGQMGVGFQSLLGGEGIMSHLSGILNGGAGGGILGGIIGLVTKAK